MCAYQGSCLPVGQLPPAPAPPACKRRTGGTCAFTKSTCDKQGAECSGFSFGFSSGITLGKCICGQGKCAVNGKCVENPEAYRAPANLDAKKIVCPVLASLFNAGFLKPDKYGRIEQLQLQQGIMDGLGTVKAVGRLFALTTAGYKEADIDEQNFELSDAAKTGAKRYLNIFRMVENKDILHQVGAAVRGGPIDPACKTYPCLKRFDEFFAKFADAQGRVYAKQLGQIAGNIYNNGYHGVAASHTLFTVTQGVTGREFLALAGWLVCFGQKDESGNRYLSVEWMKTMEMNGVFPEDWKKRGPGNPAGNLWTAADVTEVINTWRLQKVPGLSATLKFKGWLNAHGLA